MMKKKFVMALAAAILFTGTACGSNNDKTDAHVSTETSVESDASGAEKETEAIVSDESGAESTSEETSVEDMEQQYTDMAVRFALYCEYVYLGYEGRGTVTAGDITITEDTDAECRIIVYYKEPDLQAGNSSAEGGEGCMEFVINKETSQGEMTVWNYLGTSGNPMEIDMRDEASGYYGFPEDAVFDFKEGVILSADSVVANVNEYFKGEANAAEQTETAASGSEGAAESIPSNPDISQLEEWMPPINMLVIEDATVIDEDGNELGPIEKGADIGVTGQCPGFYQVNYGAKRSFLPKSVLAEH